MRSRLTLGSADREARVGPGRDAERNDLTAHVAALFVAFFNQVDPTQRRSVPPRMSI